MNMDKGKIILVAIVSVILISFIAYPVLKGKKITDFFKILSGEYVDKQYLSNWLYVNGGKIDFQSMPSYDKVKNDPYDKWFRHGELATFEEPYFSISFSVADFSKVFYWRNGISVNTLPKSWVDYAISKLPMKLPDEPVADAGGPYYGYAGYPITFNASKSYDPNGYITEYYWDFGIAWEDNDYAYGMIVNYTYYLANYEGHFYLVTLRVTDNNGNVAYAYTKAYISPPQDNKKPVADFTWYPSNPMVNEEVTFDATASYDPDGEIRGFTFDFGDGNITSGPNNVVYHTYTKAGYYNVTLEVYDNWNDVSTIRKTISISKPSNNPPIANGDGPYSGYVNKSIMLDASGSYDTDGDIVDYAWDVDNNGVFDLYGVNPYVAYTTAGNYTIKLVVTDNIGDKGEYITYAYIYNEGEPIPPAPPSTQPKEKDYIRLIIPAFIIIMCIAGAVMIDRKGYRFHRKNK